MYLTEPVHLSRTVHGAAERQKTMNFRVHVGLCTRDLRNSKRSLSLFLLGSRNVDEEHKIRVPLAVEANLTTKESERTRRSIKGEIGFSWLIRLTLSMANCPALTDNGRQLRLIVRKGRKKDIDAPFRRRRRRRVREREREGTLRWLVCAVTRGKFLQLPFGVITYCASLASESPRPVCYYYSTIGVPCKA